MSTLYIIMEGNGRQMEGTERELARQRTDADGRTGFFTIVARFLPRQQRSLSPSPPPLFVNSLTDSGSVFRRDSAPVKYVYVQTE